MVFLAGPAAIQGWYGQRMASHWGVSGIVGMILAIACVAAVGILLATILWLMARLMFWAENNKRRTAAYSVMLAGMAFYVWLESGWWGLLKITLLVVVVRAVVYAVAAAQKRANKSSDEGAGPTTDSGSPPS